MLDHFDVVVIGGGVAGLYAAHTLRQSGITNVCIVEAQNQVGGRVQQIHNIAPWPLEAGPEFVHGANSLLVKVLEEKVGMSLHEKDWPDHIYWGKEKSLSAADDSTSNVMEEVDNLMFEQLPKEPIPSEDISVQTWMSRRGVSKRTMELADVCYANDFATSLNNLGLTEAIVESRKWDAGEEYLFKDRSFHHLIDYLATGIRAITRWPVARIEWVTNQGARVVSTHGQVITCRAVICAVPITQLQQSRIQFVPPLRTPKLDAINRIHMGNAIKVFAIFSTRFWPLDMWDVVCTDRLFPEVWMTAYPVEDAGAVHTQELFCVTAFVTGEHAQRVSACTPADAVNRLVLQLDEMYAGGNLQPATASFVRGYVKDWSKVPYIEGAYTCPSLGAREGDRELIASAEGGVLFFAGEHTNKLLNPCVQGAMETGARAGLEVSSELKRRPKNSRL